MANKSKPKFPGKLNVNQIDNTYVKPSIVKELQNKSVASKTTMPIANRFSDKVNTNKVDNTYVAPSATKDLTVKTKTSNSTVPVSNWPTNKNKNAVAEAVAKRKPVKKEKVKEEEEDNDSWLENVGEFVDPTGISSYDDVYRSYKNTGLSGQTALEAFGALPLIGKIGKSGKVIAGGIGLLQDVVKGAKYLPSKMQQKVVDKAYDVYQGYAKTGGKELDKALGWSTEKLIDNIPYLNPSKWKSSTKAINSVNAAFKAGRVSDAVQAALGSKDDSGFTYNPNDDNTLKYNGRNIFPDSGASENMYANGGEIQYPGPVKVKNYRDFNYKYGKNYNEKQFFGKQPLSAEQKLDNYLGSPLAKAHVAATDYSHPEEDERDNLRHSLAGRYVTEAIANKTGNIPFISKGLGVLGANVLGAAHELDNFQRDKRNWKTKLRESGEDMFNNFAGSMVGGSPLNKGQKDKASMNLANKALPDGYGEVDPFRKGLTNNYTLPKHAGGGRVLPKFSNNRIVKYPTGGDVFSNPELANALPDNSPVRIGNEDLYKNYKPQASEYIYEKEIPVVAPVSKMPALVNKTTAPSKAVKKAIKKEETTIENMSPVKKAMITNPAKAQTFQPLAADAQAVYEEKKKNPAWKNFKGNYSIYSKENSMLHLFDNKHNLLDQTRAGRGVGKGDAPNLANPKDWYDSNKPKKGQEQAIKNATTPAGAYAIKENPMNYNDYGTKTYKFGKPNQYNAQTAMHGIYKGDTYNRTKIINDPNIKQAYVSNGCLNIPAPFLNKNDAQINSGDSLFVTKEPKFATGGKVLPRFGDAGTVDTGAGITDYAGYAQMAMPIAHMLMPDQQVKDKRGNAVGNKMDSSYAALSKGADWASKAAVAGPVASIAAGVIGAGVGYFDNEDNNRKIDKETRLINNSYYNEDTSKAFNTNTGNFTQRRSTNTNMSFAAGGQVIDEDMGNPNAELELNETFRDPMTGETGMVDGPSHDNGGIEMSLAEGTQIWSDRLKHNGRTFASLTKPIINKIANIEKGLDTNPNSRFKQNSIKLLNAQLDFFFNIQESDKQQAEMKRTLKKQEGGVVDDMGNYHYANGGIYIKPENRGKFTAYKERTGKTTEEALHSENAHVRQMANFAKNAAGWKHADGGYVLPKFYEAGTFGDPETEPNLADIYKNPYKTPTSNVNGIKVFNNPYDKRQFMLDQLNPNKNQYKAFDPAMSIYKANQNADLAKEKNSLGAEMDQMNIASRGNTPITMGPMNRPEGYIDYTNVNIPETIQGRQLPNYSLQSPTLNAYTTPETVAPKATYARKPNGINYNNPEYVDPNFQMLGTTGRTNLPTTGAGPGGVNPALFNKANYSNGDYYMNHPTPGGKSGSSADVTAAYEKQRSLDAKDQADMLAEEKSAAFKARIESYRNRGKIGQGVTAAISNQTQADRLKGLARPDKINNVNYLSSLTGPDLVNYGNQRNAIEQGASAVTDKAGRYLGNSGSIMATVNAANLAKQQQLAESYQGQENTNAGIMNQALAQKNQLSVAQAERNSAIEQENKANKYAYDAMIAAGLNSNDAITASQMGKMFGNDVSFGNDLERSRILGNKYAGKVWNSTDDNTIAANNSQLGEGKFGGVVGKLNKPMIKKGMPGKRSLKNK